jgi:putative transposase
MRAHPAQDRPVRLSDANFLKFQAKISLSMQQLLRLLQVNLFETREFIDSFRPPGTTKQCQIMQLQLI